MQHFAQFSSSQGDETEKKEGGSGLRDAAIGGLEGALGFAVTEPLVHKIQNSRLGKGFLGTKGGKIAVSAGTGALGTLAVGAGLNAAGGLLKKKPKPEEEQYNTQAQYNYQGVHFADFAPTPEQMQLAALNKQKLAQVGGDVTHPEYQAQLAKQKQAFDANRLNTATQGAQAATQAKQAATAEAKRVAGLGGLGKAKHYGGKALGIAGKLGGAALTASYILPSLMSLMPQKPQPEQEPPY